MFVAGQEFEFDGVQYRVLAGNRRKGDLVLEFRVVGWHRPMIAHTLILAAFKFQVEENNYPRPRFRGGYKLLDAIKEACKYGWKSVVDRIANERKAKK